MTIPNSDDPRNINEIVLALRQRGVGAIHQWKHPNTGAFMVDFKYLRHGTHEPVWHTLSGLTPETALDNALDFVKQEGPEWPPPPNPNVVT